MRINNFLFSSYLFAHLWVVILNGQLFQTSVPFEGRMYADREDGSRELQIVSNLMHARDFEHTIVQPTSVMLDPLSQYFHHPPRGQLVTTFTKPDKCNYRPPPININFEPAFRLHPLFT